jgi:hypothetical protein
MMALAHKQARTGPKIHEGLESGRSRDQYRLTSFETYKAINARSPERNISDRIWFDAYSSYGNIKRIPDPVDKPI